MGKLYGILYSMLSHFLFAIVVDVIELARKSVLIELLYADDLVLMRETIKGHRNKVVIK